MSLILGTELRPIADGQRASFTGSVTFINAILVQDAAKFVAPDGYMVETDCPYLAPVPFRGKTCEPAHVRLAAEKIAELRGDSVDALASFHGRNRQEILPTLATVSAQRNQAFSSIFSALSELKIWFVDKLLRLNGRLLLLCYSGINNVSHQ
jgi:hypothetical protein